MRRESKTEETNNQISRLVLGYSVVVGLNVSLSWLIFQ